MRPELRGTEGGRSFRSRFKVGLETPIVGRYVGEDRRLVFAPPRWYDVLVTCCIAGGTVAALSGVFPQIPFPFFDTTLRLWAGLSVALAGVWALLSNERLVCDLRARHYARWEGTGPFKHLNRGRLDELDAIVLVAEQLLPPLGLGVEYRLVLHWKGSRLPLLVVGQWNVPVPVGAPLNAGAGPYLALGSRYAASLGVAFFDNSYFHSGEPLKPF